MTDVTGRLPARGDDPQRVVQRARRTQAGVGPFEVQTLEFPSQAALDDFTNDPRRTALAADRDAAIARTQIIPVRLV
jgi:uncharacterized protein (DUF1330 family)